jgi:putative tricarboxylic transport membrane protein
MYDTKEWKETMSKNGLAPLDLSGDEFQQFVAESVQSIQDLSKEIGLIK